MANPRTTPHVDILRSPLGRVRGLGAARVGSHEWLITRIESVALVPLTLWFVVSVLHQLGAPHEVVVAWMSSPWVLVLMLVLVILTFHHLQLGLQNVIEDYVHQDGAKWLLLMANRAACTLVGLLCVVSVLKIGL